MRCSPFVLSLSLSVCLPLDLTHSLTLTLSLSVCLSLDLTHTLSPCLCAATFQPHPHNPQRTVNVQVLLDDESDASVAPEPIFASPFLMDVNPRECPVNEEATQQGTCECTTSAVRMGSRCMKPSEYFPIFLGILLVIVVVVMWTIVGVMRRRQDALWKIRAQDISVNDPPEILGEGAFGVVMKVCVCVCVCVCVSICLFCRTRTCGGTHSHTHSHPICPLPPYVLSIAITIHCPAG